jgi:hypothetical protein
MSRIQNLGMLRDIKQRETLARVDDEARRRKVETARDIVYERNYAVDSTAVEALLKEESLVPTSVSQGLTDGAIRKIHCCCRMRSREGLARLVSICFGCCSWTSCTNLSWGFGGLYLSIFYGCSTL